MIERNHMRDGRLGLHFLEWRIVSASVRAVLYIDESF